MPKSWLHSVHHDGSEKYVSDLAPRFRSACAWDDTHQCARCICVLRPTALALTIDLYVPSLC